MQDGIIKGTGNSRYLKSVQNFLTLYPTYQSFAQALVSGTLPIDFNGINAAGWNQIGTALNKANLLSDATASLLGLSDSSATINNGLEALANRAIEGWVAIAGTYTGDNTVDRVINTDLQPAFVWIFQDSGYSPSEGPWIRIPGIRASFFQNKSSGATYSQDNSISSIVTNGFVVSSKDTLYSTSSYNNSNMSGMTYKYFAFCVAGEF